MFDSLLQKKTNILSKSLSFSDFKKFMSASRDQRGSKQPYVRKRALAAEVLAELPYQVVNWMESFRPMEPSAGE